MVMSRGKTMRCSLFWALKAERVGGTSTHPLERKTDWGGPCGADVWNLDLTSLLKGTTLIKWIPRPCFQDVIDCNLPHDNAFTLQMFFFRTWSHASLCSPFTYLLTPGHIAKVPRLPSRARRAGEPRKNNQLESRQRRLCNCLLGWFGHLSSEKQLRRKVKS